MTPEAYRQRVEQLSKIADDALAREIRERDRANAAERENSRLRADLAEYHRLLDWASCVSLQIFRLCIRWIDLVGDEIVDFELPHDGTGAGIIRAIRDGAAGDPSAARPRVGPNFGIEEVDA